jgi:adenylosuccinate synthase
MKKVDVVLGLQWGDEGKGKVVDVLTPDYQVVARFQGGPNAGHTLEFNGEKYVLRSIPSGIFQGGKVNVIGNGVVLDPILFKEEAEALAKSGHDLTQRLFISKKAHLILPTHRILDAAFEAAKGTSKIGTTGKGIGPTYTDKISRNGVRVGDIFLDFKNIYEVAKARHENILESLGYNYNIDELERQWFEGIEYLKKFRIIDSEHEINRFLSEDKAIGRGCAGYAARRRFRLVSLRNLFEYDLRGRLHRTRYRSQPYRRGVRHLQSLLYARGQRPVPYGAVRRDG